MHCFIGWARHQMDHMGQGSKSFGTHITEEPPGHHVCIVFGRHRTTWAKYPNFFGRKQKFWYPHHGKPLGTLFACANFLCALPYPWAQKIKVNRRAHGHVHGHAHYWQTYHRGMGDWGEGRSALCISDPYFLIYLFCDSFANQVFFSKM